MLALIDAAEATPASDGAEGAPAEAQRLTLAETLDALVRHLRRFVSFAAPEHADAIALWAAHSHVPLERLEQSPILAFTSAVKQSGKSRALDVLEFVVRDAWRITRPSEAVLFRKIDADHPTVLLDEVDAIFNDKGAATEGIRSLFNSGNRQGTRVPRVVAAGKTFKLVEFDVFTPKVTAGIGGLPETVLDRAIVIPMQRRSRREPIERLRGRAARELGAPIRAALDNHARRIESLVLADSALPAELDDRAQDGWEPLIAIADAAGADWPRRARRAAITIFAKRSAADDNLGLRLLADCRTAFAEVVQDFLPSAQLRSALIALEGTPWADIRGKDITPHYLAKLLAPFGIESKRDRPAGVGNPVHGYVRADFEDAWERYLATHEESGTTGTSGTDEAVSARTDQASVPDVPLVPDAGGTETPDPDDWIDVPDEPAPPSDQPPPSLWDQR